MGIEDLKKFGLFKAELEVIELVLKGLANKEIANIRGTVRSTTTCHLARIFKKLGVKSRYEIILKYGDKQNETQSESAGDERHGESSDRQCEKVSWGK